MAGDSFINKLPLAIGVVAGGVTWLMVVFFLTAGLLNNLQVGRPAEFFAAETRPAASSRPAKTNCLVNELNLSNYCFTRREKGFINAKYTCSNGYQKAVRADCRSVNTWLVEAERVCLTCPASPVSPKPSMWPPPWPSPVPSILPSASPSTPATCVKEGETMPVYPGFSCCGGLIAIPTNKPDKDGLCPKDALLGASICAKCGDGTCGLGENFCNCSQDCSLN